MLRTVEKEMRSPLIVEATATLQQAASRMLDAATDVAIVVDQGRVAGLLTAGDVARALGEARDAQRTAVGAVADRAPVLARAGEPVIEVHERLRAGRRELAVAVDAAGRPLGLIGR
jgi:CBS domain-containing protein